jgi:formate hydrogenlyase subunit 3/multisubunit Na+/H+ antiporter MnhD subunit
MASPLLGLVMAARLVRLASTDELLVYRLGDWPAPFGIVLVLDRLSALMVLLTYLVACRCCGMPGRLGHTGATSMRCSSSSSWGCAAPS